MKFRAFLAILVIVITSVPIQAQNLVGWWAFGSGSPNDLTGNFGATLFFGATVTNGQLVVSAATGGYAQTQAYTGPTITTKTLVSWVYLDDLNAVGGSALTLEKGAPNPSQVFDGIVYAERQSGTWQAGSDYWHRTQDPPQPGTPEATAGQFLKMVVVYESNNRVTVYRNDVLYSQYTKGSLQSYAASNGTDVIFGGRASWAVNPGYDGIHSTVRLTGRIQEARVYNTALTLGQIKALQPVGTVSGKVKLEGIVGYADNQDVTFTFRPVNGGSDITQTISVPPTGDFSISRLPPAVYILHANGAKYLAANVPADVTQGNISGLSVFLRAGDADNNNIVDIGDFGVLVSAYGSKSSDPTSGYLVSADFDGDGKVDILDFSLLVNNYLASGDN